MRDSHSQCARSLGRSSLRVETDDLSFHFRSLTSPVPLTAYELIIHPHFAFELVEVVQSFHGCKEEIGIDIAPHGLG